MDAQRVAAFIDGFNLYHAIDELGRDEFKWLDLVALCRHFAPRPAFRLVDVYYFSAFATWLPEQYHRHRVYCSALRATGVHVVLGNFKEKPRYCRNCGVRWKDHEEKESDVSIAIHMIRAALRDECDRVLLITRDSDLAPAVRMIRRECPDKAIRLVTPVNRKHSMDLYRAVGDAGFVTRMKPYHLERSLLPRRVTDREGREVAIRPSKYDP